MFLYRKPVVCGITSLELDHTSILGTSIDSIAWHKSGIMKKGVPTFTVDSQPGLALTVMEDRAKEKQVFITYKLFSSLVFDSTSLKNSTLMIRLIATAHLGSKLH